MRRSRGFISGGPMSALRFAGDDRQPRRSQSTQRKIISAFSAVAFLCGLAIAEAREGSARGYPEMRDLDGRKLADGDFSQWTARDGLHVRISYVFGGGRTIVEESAFRQPPQLTQRSWSWREVRHGRNVRRAGRYVRARRRDSGRYERRGAAGRQERKTLAVRQRTIHNQTDPATSVVTVTGTPTRAYSRKPMRTPPAAARSTTMMFATD